MKVHGVMTEQVQETTYLGDIIQANGKITSNIKSRVGKGIGLVTEIMSIFKSLSFGFKFFEMAKVLREAILINGMLTNAKVWYSLGKSEISQLEQVEHIFCENFLPHRHR